MTPRSRPSSGWRRRPLAASILLSLQADRRSTLLTFLTFGLRPAIPIVIACLIKVIVDSAVSGTSTPLILAALGIAVAAGLSAGSVAYPIELNTRMIEATSAAVDEKIMTLAARLPGVTDLENPVVLDKLEVLRQERVHLSEGADAFALVLGGAVRAVVTAVVLAALDPVMLLTPLLAVPSLLASRRGQRRRTDANQAGAPSSRLARQLFSIASSPAAAAELRLCGVGTEVRARHEAIAEEADGGIVQAVAGNVLFSSLAAVLFAAGYLGALLLILRGFDRGAASLGDVVLTVGLVTMINVQVSQAVAFLGFLQQTIAAARELLWLESFVARASGGAGGDRTPPDRLAQGIRLCDVGFRYPGSETWALRDVSLEIPAGAVVAVVGANGAGKSTLIKLLAGLYQPSAGRISIDGVDLAEMVPGSWYERTSACFQDFCKLEFRAGQSVGLGQLACVDDEDAIHTAVRVGTAAEVVAALPEGLATRLGRSFDDGVDLSGGQWQRMALARARMRPAPCLLLLDEPTAAIDPLAEDAILNGYIAAASQAAATSNGVTLFASHRLSTARSADLIVVIDGGSVVEVGPHGELMADGRSRYRALYEQQARGYA